MLLTAITVLATLPISVGLSAQQFTTIDVPGATATFALSTNPPGDIVGDYQDSRGNSHGFLLLLTLEDCETNGGQYTLAGVSEAMHPPQHEWT